MSLQERPHVAEKIAHIIVIGEGIHLFHVIAFHDPLPGQLLQEGYHLRLLAIRFSPRDEQDVL